MRRTQNRKNTQRHFSASLPCLIFYVAEKQMATFYRGDCLEQMKRLESNTIQLIYWNPPFGITKQHWDEKLPWTALFAECFRLLRDDGMLVIHCSVPFNYELIRSAPKPPTYSWYWDKENPTTPLLAKIQPLRQVEEILVWKNKQNTYFPQRVGTEERVLLSRANTNYVDNEYLTPQQPKVVKGYIQRHLIRMKSAVDGFATRPEALIELIINSYTEPGDTILDPTCYRGLTGRVAKRMGRRWIGIDKYFVADYILE
jgi:site-specific DNA-methyltransferase (adenine-specific)